MAKSAVKTMRSAIVKRTVFMPVRLKNADLRTREYLTDDEVQRLAEAAKANRRGQRRHHDPYRLPPWSASLGADGPAVGPGRVHLRHAARPSRQTRHTEHASNS